MSGWFDAHNHLQDARLGDAAERVAAMREVGVSRCVVNATRVGDWDAVESLAETFPDFVLPAFGIHPWHAANPPEGWQDRLRHLLEKHPQASIGECGLDRWVDEPPVGVQMPVFLAQLEIARELARPVTIHCLKAWGPLLEAFKQCPPPARFLMHSFNGSIEMARQLEEKGAYFSFSGHFLNPHKESLRETFRNLPPERILLETDAPDMLPPADVITHPLEGDHNHPANLPAIGRALGGLLGVDDIAALTWRNASGLFG